MKFYKGMDVSTLLEVEKCGGRFYDRGEEKDALDILQSYGVNAVRVRHGGSLDFPSDWHRSAMNLAGVIFCVAVAISEEQCEGVLAGGREGVCMWAL